MNITAADVNKLRQLTGAGMMDCKKALVEAGGDFDKAIEILRKTGQKVAAKRADNETKEGLVLVNVAADGKSGKVVALACETEPVANVEDFKNMAQSILDAAVAGDVRDQEALLETKLENGQSVQENLTELIGKIGEKLVIGGFAHHEGEQVVAYVHSNKKAAGMVTLEGTGGTDQTELGRDIGMQIVAMKPLGLDKDDVDPEIVEKEIEIGKEQARAEGKKEELLEKIAMGKLNRFYKDNTLLNQDYVKDPSISVAKHIDNVHKGMKVTSYSRIAIG